MSGWYPGAVRRPMNKATKYGKRARTTAIILHVDAGNSRDLLGWWNNPGSGANGSNFHVALDGTVFQYADADYVTWTSGAVSQRSVGIETQGFGEGKWTEAQLNALADLCRWLCARYGIPVRLMTSSATSQNGIGWHAQGVPANASQKARGVSQTGGQLWSSAVGKPCPGRDRVPQVPTVVSRIGGGGSSTPTPTPGPTPVQKRPASAEQLYMLEVLGFSGTLNYQENRNLHPDGDMGPLTSTALQKEYDVSLKQILDQIKESALSEGRVRQLIREELKSARGNNPDGTPRPKTFMDELADVAIKLARLDLRYMLFETRDGRKAVQNLLTDTWSVIPDEDTLRRFLDVKRYQGFTVADAAWGGVRNWSFVRGIDGATVENVLAMGREVSWSELEKEATTLPAPEETGPVVDPVAEGNAAKVTGGTSAL